MGARVLPVGHSQQCRTEKVSRVQKSHYHLIGIGGTAMASVAGLLRSAGHHVTGSDENVYPPMSDQLRDLGIRYSEGYGANNLRSGANQQYPDVVIVGNAISRGNAELEAVLNEKIRYTSAEHSDEIHELVEGKVALRAGSGVPESGEEMRFAHAEAPVQVDAFALRWLLLDEPRK